MIGFMGCYAAITALKLARHIVRADHDARVLVVNIEVCTLHLKQTANLEKLLSFCLWGDGCAAALVTAEPTGLRLDRFHAIVASGGRDLMTWDIHDDGFDMFLSGQVPAAIQDILIEHIGTCCGRVRSGMLPFGQSIRAVARFWMPWNGPCIFLRRRCCLREPCSGSMATCHRPR